MSKIEVTFTEPFEFEVDAETVHQFPAGLSTEVRPKVAYAAIMAGKAVPGDSELDLATLAQDDEADPETSGFNEILPITALLDKKANDIIAELPRLSLADVTELFDAETAAAKPRKGVLAALEASKALKADEAGAAEVVKQAIQDAIESGEISGLSAEAAANIADAPVE